MKTILLPIRKEYSDKIFSGIKKYEFRKSLFSENIEKILVYESRGSGTIVGELMIAGVISGSPDSVWEKTKGYSGINRDDYVKYFKGKHTAYAYVIADCHRYDKSKFIADYNLSRAPQNFVWIERD